MKKIIGILGIIMITLALSLNTNSVNNSNLDLANLLSINSANAESEDAPKGKTCDDDVCTRTVTQGSTSITYYGTYYHCKAETNPFSKCISSDCDAACDA